MYKIIKYNNQSKLNYLIIMVISKIPAVTIKIFRDHQVTTHKF